MPDTTVNQQNGGNALSSILGDITSLGNTALTGYFAEQTAKNALKAPTGNTAIVVGGIVAVGVIIFLILKK